MPRHKSNKAKKALNVHNPRAYVSPVDDIKSSGTNNAKSKTNLTQADNRNSLQDENCPPDSSSTVDNLDIDTAALYNELDSFRQRWKREIQVSKKRELHTTEQPSASTSSTQESKEPVESSQNGLSLRNKSSEAINTDKCTINEAYAEAKRLFLIAVELEQNGTHDESIRNYRQAMHLYPDIEKQIFREQCEESAKASTKEVPTLVKKLNTEPIATHDGDIVQLYERICSSYYESMSCERQVYCKPRSKPKPGSLHLSDLPHELIIRILHYVVGEDLDLVSLDKIGLVCRGFYLLSKDSSLWRSICYNTWGEDTLLHGDDKDLYTKDIKDCPSFKQIDWRQMFVERPRVNYDGVYISQARYIRQGDVGFEDITYRPFHVVRYYRYLRFFSDRRVLILTTNEEPDKIIPIFRHALDSKQFSSELSILEGTFEFVNEKQINIVAEKDCRASHNLSQKRQARNYWTRQTPLSQKFNLKFELKTVDNKPYKNNTLKWLDYTILTRLETGQEITTFDLSPDTFPILYFYRVKKFNSRLTNPLTSH